MAKSNKVLRKMAPVSGDVWELLARKDPLTPDAMARAVSVAGHGQASDFSQC
jgi:hypothetical protein